MLNKTANGVDLVFDYNIIIADCSSPLIALDEHNNLIGVHFKDMVIISKEHIKSMDYDSFMKLRNEAFKQEELCGES